MRTIIWAVAGFLVGWAVMYHFMAKTVVPLPIPPVFMVPESPTEPEPKPPTIDQKLQSRSKDYISGYKDGLAGSRPKYPNFDQFESPRNEIFDRGIAVPQPVRHNYEYEAGYKQGCSDKQKNTQNPSLF